MSFALWLIWITYFRASCEVQALSTDYQSDMWKIAYGEKNYNEHFHSIDKALTTGAESTVVCLKCHGNYPHSKAEKVRSFLNAHAYYMACEVCHMRRMEGERIIYRWFDNKTGVELTELAGARGAYGGRIAPVKIVNGAKIRLDESADMVFIDEYMRLRGSFNADQEAEAKLKIHEDISRKPIFCDECHKKDGYLDFESLLFTPAVISSLQRGEVAGMIDKYKKFYLPTMFDPDMTRRQRWKPKEKR